jgi:iron complex outermembrane receptor protein
LFIDVATFWNHYHDLFSQNLIAGPQVENSLPFPEPNTVPTHILLATGQFRNDFRGFTTGGEVASEWRPKDIWRLRAAYSYLNMHLVKAEGTAPSNTPESVARASPRHMATAQSSLDLPKKVQFDFIYRYMGALPAFGVRAYSTGDVNVSWRFRPQMELSIAGRNLFQPHHLEYAGGIEIRRSVFASLAWTK